SSINISEGATLALVLRGDNALSNENLTLNNDGKINLVARSGLRGDYTVAAASGLDFGNVKSFGGTFTDNVFSVQHAGEVKVGASGGEPIAITNNSVVSVVDE